MSQPEDHGARERAQEATRAWIEENYELNRQRMDRPLRLQDHEIDEARVLRDQLRNLAEQTRPFLHDRYLSPAIENLEREIDDYEWEQVKPCECGAVGRHAIASCAASPV